MVYVLLLFSGLFHCLCLVFYCGYKVRWKDGVIGRVNSFHFSSIYVAFYLVYLDWSIVIECAAHIGIFLMIGTSDLHLESPH
jgi:hypothetical protein